MPFPGLTNYRSELAHVVLKEFDEHNVGLNQFLSKEHGPSGEHTGITADSITVEQLTAEYAEIANGVIHGDLSGTFTGPVLAQSLRLHPYKSYTLAPGDTAAFVTETFDPTVSLWYATSSGHVSVFGMFVDDLAKGRPGHIQVVINQSAFTHTYESAIVTTARRLYGCTPPVIVPSGGTIWFVYDGVNLGWRFVGSSAGATAGVALHGSTHVPGGTDPIPNAVFTNINNPWAASQVFLNGGLAVKALSGVGVLAFRSGEALTAQRKVSINVQDVDRLITLVGNPLMGDWFDQAVKTNSAPTFLRVQTPELGTFTGASPLLLFTNNTLACTIRGSDQTAIFTSHLRCSGLLEVGSGGYPFFYVGGWRVDVTANCSIPGTGGGVALPPNMAFLNIDQHWPVYQRFDVGLSFNGQDLGSWLNQSVQTTASPTFVGVTAGSGGITSNVFNTNGRTGQSGAVILQIANTVGQVYWFRWDNGILTHCMTSPPPP